MDVRYGVLYYDPNNPQIEHYKSPRHSKKRLKMWASLTHNGAVAYQEGGALTILLTDGTIQSFPAVDLSLKIYPIVLTNDDADAAADIQAIYDFCIYKIKFYKEYGLQVLGKATLKQFDDAVQRVKATKDVFLLLELFILRKNAEDLVLAKACNKAKIEAQLCDHLDTF